MRNLINPFMRILLAAYIGVVVVNISLADDWPAWGGFDPGRNMVSPEKNLPAAFEPTEGGRLMSAATQPDGRVNWSILLGTRIYGNPTVAGGRVFVGTNDHKLKDPRFKRQGCGLVYCLDEKTGQPLWRLFTPHRDGTPILPKGYDYGGLQNLGTCSSPTVVGNRVYVLTSACEIVCLDVNGLADGNDGPFTSEGQYMAGPDKPALALEPIDADIIWIYDLVKQLGVVPHDVPAGTALVVGQYVYMNSSNGPNKGETIQLAPDAPSLVVLDKDTGKLVAVDDEKIGHRMWHTQWAPPSAGVVNGKQLVFFGGADGICYAFEAVAQTTPQVQHLKKIWQYDCNPPHYRIDPDGNPYIYLRGDKRKKASPNKNDGKYIGPSEIIATPVFFNNRVYVTIGQDPAHGRGRGLIHCIDAAKTGDITNSGRVWRNESIDRSISSVTIADGLAYTADIAGTIFCFDANTGETVWTHPTASEAWATPLVADGKVYVGTRSFICVLAAGRQLKELARIKLDTASFSSPLAANGALYITSEEYLWSVTRR